MIFLFCFAGTLSRRSYSRVSGVDNLADSHIVVYNEETDYENTTDEEEGQEGDNSVYHSSNEDIQSTSAYSHHSEPTTDAGNS